MLWRKKLTTNQSGSLDLLIPACNLGSQGQEKFIQQMCCQKASQHAWSTLDQDSSTVTDLADGLNNLLRTEAKRPWYTHDLHLWRETLFAETLFTLRCGDNADR